MQRTILGILKNNTHIFAWTVILGFAIWGAGSVAIQQQSRTDIAGYVYGEKISATEFERAGRAVELLTSAGKDPNVSPEKLRDQTWQYLTLAYTAKKRGISTSDEEVIKQIRSFFGSDDGENVLDPERYEMWARNVFREKPRAFEEEVRRFIGVQKLLDEYRPKLEPSDDDVWNWYKSIVLPPVSESPKPDEAADTTKEDSVEKKPTEQDETKRREEFDKNKDLWKKSFIASKESEALGKAIEDIKKQADLKNLLPALPKPPEQEPAVAAPEAINAAAEVLDEASKTAEASATDGQVKGRPSWPPPARGLEPRAGTAPETPGKPGASSAVKTEEKSPVSTTTK